MKCIKPLVHRPEFEGKHHCRPCARAAAEQEESQ